MQKYSILNRIHSECGPCYTEHGLREHSSSCQWMSGDWQGDTLNITCNFLYCNHQVHRDFLITLYYLKHFLTWCTPNKIQEKWKYQLTCWKYFDAAILLTTFINFFPVEAEGGVILETNTYFYYTSAEFKYFRSLLTLYRPSNTARNLKIWQKCTGPSYRPKTFKQLSQTSA